MANHVIDPYFVVVKQDDGTHKAIGPLDGHKVAASYADFIHSFKPNKEIMLTCKVHYTNQYNTKSYPFPVGDYFDGGEG